MAPGVAQVARQYEGRVAFVGVPGRAGTDDMRRFVERHQLPFPQAADADGRLWSRLGVRQQPVWMFVDDGGGEPEVVFGDLEGDALRRHLDQLLDR